MDWKGFLSDLAHGYAGMVPDHTRAGMSREEYKELKKQEKILRDLQIQAEKLGVAKTKQAISAEDLKQLMAQAQLPPAIKAGGDVAQPASFGTDWTVRNTGLQDPGGGGEFMEYIEPGVKAPSVSQLDQMRSDLQLTTAYTAGLKQEEQRLAEVSSQQAQARVDVSTRNAENSEQQAETSKKYLELAKEKFAFDKEEADKAHTRKAFTDAHKQAVDMIPEDVERGTDEWYLEYNNNMYNISLQPGSTPWSELIGAAGAPNSPPSEDPEMLQQLQSHGMTMDQLKQEPNQTMLDLAMQLKEEGLPEQEWPSSLQRFMDDETKRRQQPQEDLMQ